MDIFKDSTERILAIDYGEKRIGIAISDPLRMFAIPLITIQNDSKFWINIKKIFSEYVIVKVVLGYPIKEDGSESRISSLVKQFGDQVEKKIKLKVEYVDERYSSEIAWEHIVESVPSKKKRRNKSLVDMNAAAVILEDYLKSLG